MKVRKGQARGCGSVHLLGNQIRAAGEVYTVSTCWYSLGQRTPTALSRRSEESLIAAANPCPKIWSACKDNISLLVKPRPEYISRQF